MSENRPNVVQAAKADAVKLDDLLTIDIQVLIKKLTKDLLEKCVEILESRKPGDMSGSLKEFECYLSSIEKLATVSEKPGY